MANFRLERQMEASEVRVGLLCAFKGGSYAERVGRMFGLEVNDEIKKRGGL